MFLKSNVKFTPTIEQINRKWATKKTTCSAAKQVGPAKLEANRWMGSATLTLGRAGLGVTKRNYFIFRENARTSLASADEIAAKAVFAAACKGLAHIRKDLNQITHVQQMYKAATADPTKHVNGVYAAGYGYYGWIMAVQYAGKRDDGSYDVNTFPQNFDA